MINRATHLILTALVAGLLTTVSSAQQRKIEIPAAQPKIEIPAALQLSIMIKTTLIAFNDANASGNYTVLRDLASPEFQRTNTSANLAKIFERERERKVDISAIVLLQPTLLRPAFIDNNGLLWVIGFFSSKPSWVNFKLAFKPVADRWRLEALGVLTGEDKLAANSDRNVQPRGPAMNQMVRANQLQPVRTSYDGYLGAMSHDYLGYFK